METGDWTRLLQVGDCCQQAANGDFILEGDWLKRVFEQDSVKQRIGMWGYVRDFFRIFTRWDGGIYFTRHFARHPGEMEETLAKIPSITFNLPSLIISLCHI